MHKDQHIITYLFPSFKGQSEERRGKTKNLHFQSGRAVYALPARRGRNRPQEVPGNAQRAFSEKNAGSRSSPRTRFSRTASNYDLHEMAGGMPLHTVTAPSVHPRSQSQGGRSANRQGSLTSRLKNVGPKGHNTYQAGKNVFLYYCASSSSS